jgi:glycosyltransferase involved in cell wall biosynthesis
MLGFLNYQGDARVRGYAALLRKAGCQVDVLGLHGLKNGYVDPVGVRLYSVPVSWTRRSTLRYIFEYGLSFLLLSWLVTWLHIKNRYDIIHIHNMPDFLIFCALLPKLLGARIILDIHDPMPEVYGSKFPGRDHSTVAKLLRLEERLSASFAHAVITANVHFNPGLISRGIPADKITTINNYPDPAIFNVSKRKGSRAAQHAHFTLIFPGTIAPRYGLEVAVRAMPLLKGKIPNIRLLIIGRQDNHALFLRELAQQLGVADCVDIRPSIPLTEIPEQLNQADVGIYPALPDVHMSVAIPGKVLEFAIMGVPIISSRLQIVDELLSDAAVLFFEPGNIQEFARRVMQLYTDPSLRQRLVAQADRIFAERQSQEREIRAYWDLLGRLLAERRATIDFHRLAQ